MNRHISSLEPETSERNNPPGCLVCGKPLVYHDITSERECSICHESFPAACECEDGHYVCDRCHASANTAFMIPYLLASSIRDAGVLLEDVMRLPWVNMHGPEHHAIVPCVLLTAYHNLEAETPTLNLESALREALVRAQQIPGGSCGSWGVCGAAAGAGIYASILLGATPLSRPHWDVPQRLAARCLNTIADVGGVRCCKRTSRLAVREAAIFTRERCGVEMPCSEFECQDYGRNKECIVADCPFFPNSRKHK